MELHAKQNTPAATKNAKIKRMKQCHWCDAHTHKCNKKRNTWDMKGNRIHHLNEEERRQLSQELLIQDKQCPNYRSLVNLLHHHKDKPNVADGAKYKSKRGFREKEKEMCRIIIHSAQNTQNTDPTNNTGYMQKEQQYIKNAIENCSHCIIKEIQVARKIIIELDEEQEGNDIKEGKLMKGNAAPLELQGEKAQMLILNHLFSGKMMHAAVEKLRTAFRRGIFIGSSESAEIM